MSFIGKGWRFPVDVNRQGGVAMSTEDEVVRESIAIILGTAPGERVMRPNFGCDIHDLLFAPNNPNTAGLAAFYATESLQKWEPRITDVHAEAEASREEPNKLFIHIRYKLRTTNSSHNFVYPFYLRRGDDDE